MNTWLLVPSAEVGLLARLRPAVRATAHGVLVALEHDPPVHGAQLGLGYDQRLHWFGGGLTADEVSTVVELVRLGSFDRLLVTLSHRLLARTGATTARRVGRRTS